MLLGPGPSTTRGFGQRQIRLRHRTRTSVPKHGASREDLDAPAVADRDYPAVRTADQIGVGLDVQHTQTLSTANVGIAGDVEDVHALHAEQLIGPSTPRRARTTRTMTHAKPSLDSVAWSLLVLEDLVPSRPRATPWTRTPRDGSPRLIYESQNSDGDVENPRLAPSPR